MEREVDIGKSIHGKSIHGPHPVPTTYVAWTVAAFSMRICWEPLNQHRVSKVLEQNSDPGPIGF